AVSVLPGQVRGRLLVALQPPGLLGCRSSVVHHLPPSPYRPTSVSPFVGSSAFKVAPACLALRHRSRSRRRAVFSSWRSRTSTCRGSASATSSKTILTRASPRLEGG